MYHREVLGDMNTIRLRSCKSAWALWLLVLTAAILTKANAQEKTQKPFMMKHKTKERIVEANPDKNGKWDTLPFEMPINPVHVALMHTGKVLIVSGSGNDPDNHDLQAAVWDPKTATVTTFKIAWDMFCNGMVVLPDGRPFVLGGTLRYDDEHSPFHGEPRTAAFSPLTEKFVDMPSMGGGRWYPTGTVLGDGSVLVYSGLGTDGSMNRTVQIWTGK